ncbi:hypothetical protein F4808DRAFT_257992 [Astrocystis sublimbata]|nr:hypothetical protein F4808DRAFT_257992 [Astrocystis sublimbata]
MRASTITIPLLSSLLTVASAAVLPQSPTLAAELSVATAKEAATESDTSSTKPTINLPWTITEYKGRGPHNEGEQLVTFRVKADDNYVDTMKGIDVICTDIPMDRVHMTPCEVHANFYVEAYVAYHMSYPKVQMKINHVQTNPTNVMIAKGDSYVLPGDSFELAVQEVVFGV